MDSPDTIGSVLTATPVRSLASPKRRSDSGVWLDYYAGYADEFVRQIVGDLKVGGGTVLDPWNGSGTTTAVAASHSIAARGFDLNPAAVIVAKARLTRSDVADSLLPLCEELLSAASTAARTDDDELLTTWIEPASARRVRALEQAIRALLVPGGVGRLTTGAALDRCSSLAALFLLALFRVVRQSLAPFQTSNPTWLRLRVDPAERVRISSKQLRQRFRAACSELTATVQQNSIRAPDSRSEVSLASSEDLPVAPDSVAAVVTSPPYCTRIDYAVAMAPELAALGLTKSEWTGLRRAMIGTPFKEERPAPYEAPAPRLTALLDAVANHSTYAARNYYLPFFVNYFARMEQSLRELDRVTIHGAPVVMVVQDSFFKNVHVDTPRILNDVAEATLGWRVAETHRFTVTTRAAQHPHRRTHRTSSSAVETVSILET